MDLQNRPKRPRWKRLAKEARYRKANTMDVLGKRKVDSDVYVNRELEMGNIFMTKKLCNEGVIAGFSLGECDMYLNIGENIKKGPERRYPVEEKEETLCTTQSLSMAARSQADRSQ